MRSSNSPAWTSCSPSICSACTPRCSAIPAAVCTARTATECTSTAGACSSYRLANKRACCNPSSVSAAPGGLVSSRRSTFP
ncbi:Uncharacterised protein [Mycobacteroides abscessus subsp. abscessus]|nr:Uncharacterised protein [Mycobacteroides abscessus subsp. abscessus]